MDASKVDLLIQYALAAAAQEEFPDNQLGPIHLIKYVYIGDLAYAGEHGSTLTGARWTFYDFGPWSEPVNMRIEEAIAQVGAEVRRLESNEGREYVRYVVRDSDLRDELEPKLPIRVTRAIDRAVKRYGCDTAALLEHVYLTDPIRTAEPNAILVFRRDDAAPSRAEDKNDREPSAKAAKKRQKRVRDLRDRVRKLQESRADQRAEEVRPPRYDAVFEQGQRWLDGLMPDPPPEIEADLVVDQSVWKSRLRTDGEVP